MNAKMEKGSRVRGVVCGRFVVKSVKGDVVSVNEVGPEGQISRKTLRFPAEMLVADEAHRSSVCPDEAFPRV